MIGEILVKTLTCLLISPLFLACWRGMINLIYLFYVNASMVLTKPTNLLLNKIKKIKPT